MFNPDIPVWYSKTMTPWYGVAENLPIYEDPGKKKIAVFMVATPEIKYYSTYTESVNSDWAQKHKYDFFIMREKARGMEGLPINFSKIQYTLDLLKKDYDYVIHIDADAIIINPSYDIRNLIKEYMGGIISVMFGEDCFGPHECSKPGKINSGVFVVKNNQLGKKVMETWRDTSFGKCAKFVNQFPSCQLVFSNCVFPKWFWTTRIIPYNLMNGFKKSLLLKHVMAKSPIQRVDEIKKIYSKNTQQDRIRVF